MANNRELSQFANVVGYNGGNIGIGTDNPSSSLQVGHNPNNGTGAGVAAGSNGALKVARAADADQLIEGYKVGDSSANFVIRADGNTGIGTNSPNAKLQIYDGNANDHGDGILLSKQGGNIYGIYPSTNNLEFKSVTGNTHIATFDYSGNIGIGTDNPSYKLQVENSGTALGRFLRTNAGAALFQIMSQDGGNITLGLGDVSDPDIQYIKSDNSDNSLSFGTNTSERFRIDSDGYRSFSTQPYALLRKDGTSQSITADAFVQYDETITSEGGMAVSTDKDRITVPKTGKYAVFGCAAGSNTTVSVGDGWRCEIWLNGSVYSNIYTYPINSTGASTGEEYNIQAHLILPASANDYFEIKVASVGAARANVRYGYFCVYYLG